MRPLPRSGRTPKGVREFSCIGKHNLPSRGETVRLCSLHPLAERLDDLVVEALALLACVCRRSSGIEALRGGGERKDRRLRTRKST
jgi:hypothetical protein